MGQKLAAQAKTLVMVGQPICHIRLGQVKVRVPMKNLAILIVAAAMHVDKGINMGHYPMTAATAQAHPVVAMKAYRLAANHKMAPNIKHQEPIRLLLAQQIARLPPQARIKQQQLLICP
jgi:hypothetical protein